MVHALKKNPDGPTHQQTVNEPITMGDRARRAVPRAQIGARMARRDRDRGKAIFSVFTRKTKYLCI